MLIFLFRYLSINFIVNRQKKAEKMKHVQTTVLVCITRGSICISVNIYLIGLIEILSKPYGVVWT